MTPELIRLLGWVDHCSTTLPGQALSVPIWLCPHGTLEQAIEEHLIGECGTQAFVPRLGMYGIVFGLTDTGRKVFYEGMHLMNAETGDACH